jgi:hypothetical protein
VHEPKASLFGWPVGKVNLDHSAARRHQSSVEAAADVPDKPSGIEVTVFDIPRPALAPRANSSKDRLELGPGFGEDVIVSAAVSGAPACNDIRAL